MSIAKSELWWEQHAILEIEKQGFKLCFKDFMLLLAYKWGKGLKKSSETLKYKYCFKQSNDQVAQLNLK